MAINEFTGDALATKPMSQEGQENWDKIFGKKERVPYVYVPPTTEENKDGQTDTDTVHP